MKRIPIPERLTERVTVRISKVEKAILRDLARVNKTTQTLVIRHLIQTSIETDGKVSIAEKK